VCAQLNELVHAEPYARRSSYFEVSHALGFDAPHRKMSSKHDFIEIFPQSASANSMLTITAGWLQ
jgi:hypothetical protein